MTTAEHGRRVRSMLKVIGTLALRMPLFRAIMIFLCSAAGMVLAFKPTLTDLMLLPSEDPLFFYASFSAARHLGSPLDLQTFAFGQEFGEFQHPGILNPFWWVLDATRSVVVAYYWLAWSAVRQNLWNIGHDRNFLSDYRLARPHVAACSANGAVYRDIGVF
jgi:hypothetical protein